jgi:glycosyltransferase involved in cell wall biosynthesis
LRTRLRHWLGPLTIRPAAHTLAKMIHALQPDLVHAMRIPYEGMLAAAAMLNSPEMPLAVSVWGNDFTLHAPATLWMGNYTRLTLRRANGLHTDCRRDQSLARQWGFPAARPSAVLPGNGGIRLDEFHSSIPLKSRPEFVINPRGFRAYVRNDVFFRAIPLVLRARPGARFVCPAMQGEARAERWLKEYGIGEKVELLPKQTREQMADLFCSAQVSVSPSTHDGTPNTLLESMACGCFPIAGEIESLYEWITPGLNGFLIDPADARSLSEAILVALRSPELREQAASHNRQLVADRAEFGMVMRKARRFYEQISRART